MGEPKSYSPVPLEEVEQTNLFRWALYNLGRFPELEHLFFAIPNGGLRTKATAGKLKAQGVKPGVPDTFLSVARHGYHGLYIEMKRTKGGSLSEDQKKMIPLLRAQGYRVEVCYGWEEAVKIIEDYLEG